MLVFGSSPLFADSTEQPPAKTANVTTDNASTAGDKDAGDKDTSNQATSDSDD